MLDEAANAVAAAVAAPGEYQALITGLVRAGAGGDHAPREAPGAAVATSGGAPRSEQSQRHGALPLDAVVGAPEPPQFVEEAAARLPPRSSGSPTRGVLLDAAGRLVADETLGSGTDRSTSADLVLATRSERHSRSLLPDVEPKAAAMVRRGQAPSESMLVLNNWPCEGPLSCDEYLPSILPAGARMAVYVHDGGRTTLFKVYQGDGSRIRP